MNRFMVVLGLVLALSVPSSSFAASKGKTLNLRFNTLDLLFNELSGDLLLGIGKFAIGPSGGYFFSGTDTTGAWEAGGKILWFATAKERLGTSLILGPQFNYMSIKLFGATTNMINTGLTLGFQMLMADVFTWSIGIKGLYRKVMSGSTNSFFKDGFAPGFEATMGFAF